MSTLLLLTNALLPSSEVLPALGLLSHQVRVLPAEGTALLIPPGFAHGFQALSDEAELVYCHSTAYAPQAEAGLHARDVRLSIHWPLPVHGLSARDAAFEWLNPDFKGVLL